MSYAEKMARKNTIPYMRVERIYIGDSKTYIESGGDGIWRIVSPTSIFKIEEDGSIYISGNVKIDSPLRVTGDIDCDKTITTQSITDKSKEVITP